MRDAVLVLLTVTAACALGGDLAWNAMVKQDCLERPSAHTCSVLLGSQRQEAAKNCVRGRKAGRQAGGEGGRWGGGDEVERSHRRGG